MPMSQPDPERYQPMPSLLALPGWLLRKLPRKTRIVVTALLVLLLVGGLAAVVLVALPSESRRNDAQRRLERRQLLARLAEVRRIQRARPFTLGVPAGAGAAAIQRGVERAVAAAARTRRARCTLYASAPRLTFNCDAIKATNAVSVVSVPWQAHVAPGSRRGALCRKVPPPDVPDEEELRSYRLPRRCGGLGR